MTIPSELCIVKEEHDADKKEMTQNDMKVSTKNVNQSKMLQVAWGDPLHQISTVNNGLSKSNMMVPRQIISQSNVLPIRALLPNPTIPPNAARVPPSALAALTRSLQTRINWISEQRAIPMNHGPSIPQYEQVPPTTKDERLDENWATKIAYAATLSSVK